MTILCRSRLFPCGMHAWRKRSSIERRLQSMRELRGRSESVEARPPVPPFGRDDAIKKVRAAEGVPGTLVTRSGWRWLTARAPVAQPLRSLRRPRRDRELLTRKWAELDYRLIKEMWAFSSDRIAVRFAYEWHDDAGSWFRPRQ